MTGGRHQRFAARQPAEAPCDNQDGSMEQMSIPWGLLETRGVGNRRKKRLDFLHMEWNFFSWALKERITLNAGKPGDSWITLW